MNNVNIYKKYIMESLDFLPEDKLAEVNDFVDFIRQKLEKETEVADRNDFEKALLATHGIWKDELNGIAYENKIRGSWKRQSQES